MDIRFLSRRFIIVLEVDDAKVAEGIAKQLDGLDIEVPFNVVTPSLRDELVKRGVKIGEPEKSNAGKASLPAYEEWLESQGGEDGKVRFMAEDGSDKDEKHAFFANIERVVEAINEDSLKAERWSAKIKGRGGFKNEENQILGLSKWLQKRKGEDVTKEELIDLIRQSQIQADNCIAQYTEEEKNAIREREVENTIIDSKKEKLPSTLGEVKELIPAGDGLIMENKDQGVKIRISRHTATHSIPNDEEYTIKAFGKIHEIVEKAVKIGNMPVAIDELGSTNSASIYYAPVNVDGVQYSARMVVKELAHKGAVLENLSLYHVGMRKEKAPSNYNVGTSEDGLAHFDNAISAYKVKDLIYSTQVFDQKLLEINKEGLRFSAEDDFVELDSEELENMDAEERAEYRRKLDERNFNAQQDAIDYLSEKTGVTGYGINSKYLRGETEDGESYEVRISGHVANPDNFGNHHEDGEADHILSIVIDPDFDSVNTWKERLTSDDESKLQLVYNPLEDVDWDAVARGVEYFKETGETWKMPEEGSVRFRADDDDSDNSLMGYEVDLTRALLDLAQKNRDNVSVRLQAMRSIGGNLSKLRQAMARQREYDRSTVDGIVRLANTIIRSGIVSSRC